MTVVKANGYGSGDGNGFGRGFSYGYGSGNGYGFGRGYGYGFGYGYGNGDGNGFERDGLTEEIDSSPKVYQTRDEHVVEEYQVKGKKRFFVTLAGTHYCAHGSSLEEAITDATWKDISKRPSLEALKSEIQIKGKNRPISLNEFQVLTGACTEGCRIVLKRAGLDGSPMLAKDIAKYFPEWGARLYSVLEWE